MTVETKYKTYKDSSGLYIHVDDVYDYAMEYEIDTIRDAILESAGSDYEDMRNDLD